jgi:hypothetical protein
MFRLFLKVVDMDIKVGFSSQGSYADGLKALANCLVTKCYYPRKALPRIVLF